MSGCTPDSSGDCKGTKETTPPYTVTIADGDTINGSAYGWLDTGDVYKADVQMTGGRVTGSVYGGHTINSAYSNTVSITGGQVDGSVEGGYSSNCASYNKVTIGGTAQTGDVKGGLCDGNEVTIEGNATTGNVYGATGRRAGSENEGIKPNTVTVRGGTINGNVYGGSANYADNNQVLIEGGTVTGDVIGSQATNSGYSHGNSVVISGGEVGGSVWGSHADGSLPQTRNNSVTISGGKVTGVVYGGNDTSGTGNTLNVEGKNLPVGGVANFKAINFTLPAGFDAASDVALNITGTEAVNLEGVTIDVGGSIPTLAAGESLTLISSTRGKPASITGLPSDYKFDETSDELIIKPKIYIITATATPDGAGTIKCDPNPVPEGAIVTCSVTFSGDYNKVGDLTNLQASLPAGVTCTPASETAVTCTGMTNDLSVEIPLIKENTDPGTGGGGGGGGGTDPGTGGGSTGGDTPGGDTPGGDTPGGDTPGGDTPGGNTPGAGGGGDSSSPTMGELGLLLSGIALAGAAAPALRRRERKARKQD